jgi:hypothetical protein
MRSTLVRIVLACTLLAAGLPVVAAADPSLVVAAGKVEIGHGTPPIWHVAQSGEALAPGDSVRTAAGARAELQLGDNRIVRVYESSVLRVGTSVTPTGAVRSVDLDEGQSIFDVMKKTVADEFDVVTPEIVVSVKGTRFLVAAARGADYTSVFRGVVGLAGKGFEAVSVRPGMTGAQGELFLTPYADPWAAWETDASAPEPAIDEGHHELGAAVQAAVDGVVGGGSSSGGGGSGGSSKDPGLVGGLVGGLLASVTDPGSAGASAPGGAGDDGSLLGGVTGAVGETLAPVIAPVGALVNPLVDPVVSSVVDPVLSPVLTPVVTPVGGLLGGLLGGNRSP